MKLDITSIATQLSWFLVPLTAVGHISPASGLTGEIPDKLPLSARSSPEKVWRWINTMFSSPGEEGWN